MEAARKQWFLWLRREAAPFLSWEEKSPGEVRMEISRERLEKVTRLIKERGGRLFTMVGNDEREREGHFALYYVYAFDPIHAFVTVKVRIPEEEPTFPSLSSLFPAFNWYEREVKDLFGLRPLGHPDPRPLVLHGDWPEDLFPLRKDYPKTMEAPRVESRETYMPYGGEDVTEVPVGPIHAGIIEPGHFRFGVVGDTILHLDARLFYTHKGLEKEAEGMPVEQALLLAERACGVCAYSHGLAFAQAVERIAGVEVPPRAKALRAIYQELERLYNHIGEVGNLCAGFGLAVGVSHGARLKELLQQLNERLTGHRYIRGAVSLGGVKEDLGSREIRDLHATLPNVREDFSELAELILGHEVAINRMNGTGVLSPQVAQDLEVVGLTARASGRDLDTRRDLPYGFYEGITVKVPLQRTGDVLARLKQRIEEVEVSFSLIEAILTKLPRGEIRTEIGRLPSYEAGFGWVESPRGETVHWLMTGPENRVERLRIRSATYSNWPAVPFAVKGNIVPDFPLINKSFELCYACCDR
ncbi:NADH dehydrogenase subunit E [[Clostridium] ultunense Esp]|nr:NADH dehydrogenase subunit E [[Clostridium] ultunense Esp]